MDSANIAGFIGSITILSGFARQTWTNAPPDLIYHLANLIGASLLAYSLTVHFNLPALLLELAWAGIALVGTLRWLVKR